MKKIFYLLMPFKKNLIEPFIRLLRKENSYTYYRIPIIKKLKELNFFMPKYCILDLRFFMNVRTFMASNFDQQAAS